MARFNIRIDPVWSVPLLIIGATQARSWVEVGDTELEVRFGVGHQRIRLADVASVAPHEWSLFYGIGHRLGYSGVGYVGSIERVVKITLKGPVRFDILLGIEVPFSCFFVSLDDPEAFIKEVSGRLTAAG